MLLRHAKAEPSMGNKDHQRSLDEAGVAEAGATAGWMLAGGWRPDLVLVSDAARTRQTADRVAAVFDSVPAVVLQPSLYDAPSSAILALIQAAPDEAERLLVVGHNPGIGEAARQVARHGATADLARLAAHFPTAAVAVIGVWEAYWRDVGAGGTLIACHGFEAP